MSDRGKIRARRVSGNCAEHQRDVAAAIKTARELALLPYTQRTVSERGPGRGSGAGAGGRPGGGTRDRVAGPEDGPVVDVDAHGNGNGNGRGNEGAMPEPVGAEA